MIRLGHNVLTADHVADALRLLRLTCPHLIILDGEMWLYSLMTLRQHSNTPLILLKSNDEVRERETSLQLGADDVVIKPFSVKGAGGTDQGGTKANQPPLRRRT